MKAVPLPTPLVPWEPLFGMVCLSDFSSPLHMRWSATCLPLVCQGSLFTAHETLVLRNGSEVPLAADGCTWLPNSALDVCVLSGSF